MKSFVVRRRHRPAFTLLETVVAITILSVFFASALSVLQTAQRLAGTQGTIAQTRELAQQAINEVRLLRDTVPGGTSLATFFELAGGSSYGMVVADTSTQNGCDGTACQPAASGGPLRVAWCVPTSASALCVTQLARRAEVTTSRTLYTTLGQVLSSGAGPSGRPAELLAVRRTAVSDWRSRVDALHPTLGTELELQSLSNTDQQNYRFFWRQVQISQESANRYLVRVTVQDAAVPSARYIAETVLTDTR